MRRALTSISLPRRPRFRPGAVLAAPLLRPATSAGAGEVLWGEAPRRQPIVPLLAMAIITLLVAAPAAMSGQGQSSNPVVLLQDVSKGLWGITEQMDIANGYLKQIDENARPMRVLSANMTIIAAAADGMGKKTGELNDSLSGVGGAVRTSKGQLKTVDGKLTQTAGGMAPLKTAVGESLSSTNAVVAEFGTIDRNIGKMDGGLKSVIGLMGKSVPQTRAFATNKTRLSVTGGDGHKFGIPNLVPGNRVMSVVLPMINTMQKGGPMAVRKDTATASNPLVGALLKRQIPDGTNTAIIVQKYDGFYGLPDAEWFVNHPIDGF